MHYVDRFLSMKCATDLKNMGLFRTSKQIVDAFALRYAIGRVPLDYRDGSVSCVVIPDKNPPLPHLAALIAFTTSWNVTTYSVGLRKGYYGLSPHMLRIFDMGQEVQARRLNCIKGTPEQYGIPLAEKTVFVFPDSFGQARNLLHRLGGHPYPYWVVGIHDGVADRAPSNLVPFARYRDANAGSVDGQQITIYEG